MVKYEVIESDYHGVNYSCCYIKFIQKINTVQSTRGIFVQFFIKSLQLPKLQKLNSILQMNKSL